LQTGAAGAAPAVAVKSSAVAFPAARLRSSDFLALTKPRLNFLVIATAMAGYYMGAGRGTSLAALVHTVMGTALVAGGAAALNQVYERDVDALMNRTRRRPLPAGRLQPAEASWFALGLSLAGLVQLAAGVNVLSSIVALVTLVTYIACYTPLKLRTSLSTVVGAIPGALPPLIGWAAATGTLSREGWLLVAIVFLWQMPHFLAIAWLYRDDYARAGFPLLPVLEPDGRSTARQALAYAAALLPVSVAPTMAGMTSGTYFAGAAVLGLALLAATARFAICRTARSARWLFLASILYLPLLWGLMIATRAG
jgi:protoheme IX farnesyltransferase